MLQLNYSSNGYNILNGNGPAAGSVSRNKWHHIAVTRSGGTEWKIYVDGIEKWNASRQQSRTIRMVFQLVLMVHLLEL